MGAVVVPVETGVEGGLVIIGCWGVPVCGDEVTETRAEGVEG